MFRIMRMGMGMMMVMRMFMIMIVCMCVFSGFFHEAILPVLHGNGTYLTCVMKMSKGWLRNGNSCDNGYTNYHRRKTINGKIPGKFPLGRRDSGEPV